MAGPLLNFLSPHPSLFYFLLNIIELPLAGTGVESITAGLAWALLQRILQLKHQLQLITFPHQKLRVGRNGEMLFTDLVDGIRSVCIAGQVAVDPSPWH